MRQDVHVLQKASLPFQENSELSLVSHALDGLTSLLDCEPWLFEEIFAVALSCPQTLFPPQSKLPIVAFR